MVTTADNAQCLDEELNVKKKRTATRELRCGTATPIRRTLVATGEFYRGLAEAIAEGLRVFNDELDSADSSNDLPTAIVDGLAEANARFYEEMAATTRKAVDSLKTEDREPSTVVIGLDYERLAQLVAAELRKSESSSETIPDSGVSGA
jgi:hypothetical protein